MSSFFRSNDYVMFLQKNPTQVNNVIYTYWEIIIIIIITIITTVAINIIINCMVITCT